MSRSHQRSREINRRAFLQTTSALALGGAVTLLGRQRIFADDGRKPNILFVFSDEHRACSTGCYGDTQIKTPSLDTFSKQGARLDACISTTPVCCPYRATLMTGMLGHENGVVTNEVNLKPAKQGATLGSTFRKAGYTCGYIGKWHLGPTATELGPARFGFDDYWAAAVAPHNYTNMNYNDDTGKVVKGPGDYAPALQTDQAIAFIEKNKEKPWLLMLSWGPPHPPYTPPAKYDKHSELKILPNVPSGKASAYASANLGKYYGLVESLDDEFGRLTAKLQALGLAENTIVVYTSDHGDMLGSQGLLFKRWPHDESSRVPFLIRWPGHIPEKSAIAMPFGTQDIFPTLTGLAGIDVPAGIHGRDFSAAMLGQPKAKTQEYCFMTMQHGYVPWPGWRGLRTSEQLYARTETESWFLYDLKNDPYQQHNLLKDKAERARELDALLLDSMKKLGESWRGGPRNVGDHESFADGGMKDKTQYLGGEWPKK